MTKENCEMCGVEKEIIATAHFVNHTQKICGECLIYSIPKYTTVYQTEKVESYRGEKV